MRHLLIFLLILPALRGDIYRVSFVGQIETVHLVGPDAEELTAGSIVTGSFLIDSESRDAQPTVPSYGGYGVGPGEILIGQRRFSNRGALCFLYDNFSVNGVVQDRVAIGASLDAYGPRATSWLYLRLDPLPLDALDSVALSPTLNRLPSLPLPRIEIKEGLSVYSSTTFARGSVTELRVDIVRASTLSLIPLASDRRVLTFHRPAPGDRLTLQRSFDLLEWADIAQSAEGSATFQWLDVIGSERVFYRLK